MEQRLFIDEDRWNNDKFIAFQNGYLDSTNNQFKSCDREDYLTSVLPYNYDETAKCHEFEKFINYAMGGNQQLIELLKAWIKWIILPKPKSQKFPIEKVLYLIGRKGTGKGTFLDVLMQLLGEGNYGSASPKNFSNPEALSQMLDKKACIDSDASGYLENVGDFNKVVSNEPVSIRTLYVGSSTKRLDTVRVMAMHEFISTPSTGSEGLDRRICPIPFSYKPQTLDVDLSEKLSQELAGIFQWAWQLSFTQVKKNILFAGNTEAVAQTARERFYNDHPEFNFLCEYYPYGGEYKATDVYSSYVDQVKESGLKQISLKKFGQKIRELEFETPRHSDGIFYKIPDLSKFDLDSFLGIGSSKTIKVSYQEIIDLQNQEFKRLGWNLETCKSYVKKHYGAEKRPLLNDEQLLDLLEKLQEIPNSISVEEMPENKELYISFGKCQNEIKLGKKTVTRRNWNHDYANKFKKAFLKGEKIPAYDFSKINGGSQIGWLQLETMPYLETLQNMPESHLTKEGSMCDTKEQFINKFFQGNKLLEIYVLEFKFNPIREYQ